MRQRFDGQLAALNRELISMGALCEEAIAVTARSVLDADRALAGRISALEEEIDQKEREIERVCLRLLLQQQPVAGDLRQISAALKMITDMERIGDQALDIAETAGFMGELDEADAAKLRGLISETQTVQDAYPAVLNIMAEDAAQFFAGQITAEQAAVYTQNRVSTWLAEQG